MPSQPVWGEGGGVLCPVSQYGGGGLKTSLKARARTRRAVINRERERFVQQKNHYRSKCCLKR